MQKTPRSQVPALESTKKVSIHTYGCYIHAKKQNVDLALFGQFWLGILLV